MRFVGFAKTPIYTHERWCESGLNCTCAVLEPEDCRICLTNNGTPKANGVCLTCRREMGWHIDHEPTCATVTLSEWQGCTCDA